MGIQRKLTGDILDLGILIDHPAAQAGRVLIYSLADKIYQRFPNGEIKAVGSGEGTGGGTGWATTGKLDDFDAASSTFVTAPTGDDTKIILTATEAGQVFVFKAVDIPMALEQNYYAAIALADANFTAKVECFNSAWIEAGGTIEPCKVNEIGNLLIPFSKKDFTKARLVITSQAVGTFTLSRGEWTDSYWKEVQYNGDSVITEKSSNAGQTVLVNAPIPFGDLTSYTAPFDGEVNFVGQLHFTTANAIFPTLYKNNAIFLISADNSASTRKPFSFACSCKKGDVFSIRPDAGITLVASAEYHYITITATPIGTSKGIVAAAEVDLSQYQYPSYDESQVTITSPTAMSGFSVVRARITPYKTSNGVIRLSGNIGVTVSTVARTEGTIGVTGVVAAGDNTYYQAFSADTLGVTGSEGEILGTTGNFRVVHPSGNTGGYYISFDIELASWPTWATQPTIKPATIIAPVAVKDQVVYIKDVKANGNAGGGAVAGTQIRTLNTVEGDSSIVSLASNRITLQAGEYRIDAKVPAFYVNTHVAYLYNETDSIRLISGSNEYSSVTGAGINTSSRILGSFTLTKETDLYIGHYTQTARTVDGLGYPTGDTASETYTQVKITKIGETGFIASSKEEIHKHVHNKSTNEKKVGTWFGQPLYEKSYSRAPSTEQTNPTLDTSIGANTVTPRSGVWRYDGVRWRQVIDSASTLHLEPSALAISGVAHGYQVTIKYTKNAENP